MTDAAEAAKTSCRLALVMMERANEKATTKMTKMAILTPADVCKIYSRITGRMSSRVEAALTTIFTSMLVRLLE